MAGSDVTDLRILSPDHVAAYHERGYTVIEEAVDDAWLDRLQAATDEFVEQSRSLTKSNRLLDLEPDHTADQPRLRRLNNPVDNHQTFAEFALAGVAADVAADLLGAPARFHHSKLNFKWSDGGEAVEWHQDIQYWPHSDFTPLTIGVYLDDVDSSMGPMGILPGSHTGDLYNLYAADGVTWSGSIRPDDLAQLDLSAVEHLVGSAGTITVHNCCCVHGSAPNESERARPLLLQTYSAANSFPLLGVGVNGATGGAAGTMVGGGSRPQQLVVDGRSIPAAPDWSGGGYTTIFDVQQSAE